MKTTRALLCLLLLAFSSTAYAAAIDTVATYSTVMNKEIKAVVVTPNGYNKATPTPVVYLLHGYSDSYNNGFLKKGTDLEQLADTYKLIIVCCDGGFGSWYFDSPVDKRYRYETYITAELIPWIDSHYSTVANRKGRGITGLSMGGHGALYLAIRHQDLFCTAGSMSGGVDIRPFPNNWDIAKRLGSYAEYSESWEKNTVVNMLHLLTPNSLALIIDCGTEDFFYKVNCDLHDRLLARNIPHDFISRPGGHTWDYWRNAIGYQMLYMSKQLRRE